MPDMQRLDPSGADRGSVEAARVRQPSSLQHARNRHRDHWPFLFYERKGTWYRNVTPRHLRKEDPGAIVGEASW